MAQDSHASRVASIQRSDTPASLGKVGQVLGDGLERSQPAQRLDIPGETLAANHRDAGAGRHGVAAEFLALADVGDVHLDGGARGDALQGVVQGDAGVGVGAEVDDESLGAAVGERVDAVDERALVVGLEEADRHAELPGLPERHDPSQQSGQRLDRLSVSGILKFREYGMDEYANRQFTSGKEHRYQHCDEVNHLMHRLTSAAQRSSSAAPRRRGLRGESTPKAFTVG
jgi:hypothetical protein